MVILSILIVIWWRYKYVQRRIYEINLNLNFCVCLRRTSLTLLTLNKSKNKFDIFKYINKDEEGEGIFAPTNWNVIFWSFAEQIYEH